MRKVLPSFLNVYVTHAVSECGGQSADGGIGKAGQKLYSPAKIKPRQQSIGGHILAELPNMAANRLTVGSARMTEKFTHAIKYFINPAKIKSSPQSIGGHILAELVDLNKTQVISTHNRHLLKV